MGSSSNPEDNLVNPTVPDFDEAVEVEKTRMEIPKHLEDRCKWLEEKFKALENVDYHGGIDAKDLSLVPDLVLPPKFKMPEFEKYNETSCPEAHITIFCRRMTGYIHNDQLLIHCFQDSLIGEAAKWYNQLNRGQISSWKDLAQAFMKQYGYVTDIAPDRITLQNMEKKLNESFRQYAQRWREIATQVQLPLLEKETTMCGKIEVGESTKKLVPRKRENEINNVSRSYAKPITVNQPRIVNASQQASSKQESDIKRNTEKLQFTSIPVTYKELYQTLFNAHVVSPVYLKPMQPPYPKWYNENVQCEYHAVITGHAIENYTAFKRLVEKLHEMGIIKFDKSSGGENPLPNHADKEVNAVIENTGKRVRMTVAEVRTPLREVWKEIMKKGLIAQSLGNRPQKIGNYCEFHDEEDHEIQECDEFRALIKELMDKKEQEFFEYVEERDVCTSEGGSLGKDCEINRPRVIISQPKINEVGLKMAPRIVIQKPVAFPYKDSKRVPWSYNCNVTIPGGKN
ncbi:uncharacterized protein LOC108462636 [Gossypium arboreum]|uniref:uncharacterized protein LOC108462636 n=1 Tax=Gossypium arboreum TaxID=29729 RepID=UPI0008195EFE|nr:uncharacterized protein LOC108462636 [Gossypium arboreum]